MESNIFTECDFPDLGNKSLSVQSLLPVSVN